LDGKVPNMFREADRMVTEGIDAVSRKPRIGVRDFVEVLANRQSFDTDHQHLSSGIAVPVLVEMIVRPEGQQKTRVDLMFRMRDFVTFISHPYSRERSFIAKYK